MKSFRINTKLKSLTVIVSTLLTLSLIGLTSCGDGGTSPEQEFFFPDSGLSYSQHIRPMFIENCATFGTCHQTSSIAGGLDLESDPPNFFSNSGLVVIPFSRTQSLLYELLFVSVPGTSNRMPPEGAPLADEQIEAIGQWIDEGALFSN